MRGLRRQKLCSIMFEFHLDRTDTSKSKFCQLSRPGHAGADEHEPDDSSLKREDDCSRRGGHLQDSLHVACLGGRV